MGVWYRQEASEPYNKRSIEAGFDANGVVFVARCLAKLHECDSGDITPYWNEDTLLHATHLDQERRGRERLRKAMARAILAGKIVAKGDTFVIPKWQIYNPNAPKDTTAAERKRKWRKKKEEDDKKEKPSGNGNVPRDSHGTSRSPGTECHNRDSRVRARDARDIHTDGTVHTNDTNVTYRDGRDVTPDATHTLRFCQRLVAMLKKHGGGPNPLPDPADWVSATEMRAGDADMDEAMAVCSWVFEESPVWRDGGSWRGKVTDASSFWKHYGKLRAQYLDHRKGARSPHAAAVDPGEDPLAGIEQMFEEDDE